MAAAVMLFAGCSIWTNLNTQTVRLPNVAVPQTLILKKKPAQKAIHSYEIVGRGNVKGRATITLMLNNKPYKVESLSGIVRFHWGGDWYADEAEVHYEPQEVKGGILELKYKFEDL